MLVMEYEDSYMDNCYQFETFWTIELLKCYLLPLQTIDVYMTTYLHVIKLPFIYLFIYLTIFLKFSEDIKG